MPKNKGKGGKNRKRGKNEADDGWFSRKTDKSTPKCFVCLVIADARRSVLIISSVFVISVVRCIRRFGLLLVISSLSVFVIISAWGIKIYDKSLRAKALSIVHNCTSMLGVMSGVYKAEASHLMSPMLQQWMMQFSAILSLPVEYEDPDDWSMRMEVLKCLSQFVQHFSAATAKDFMVIVGPLWQTFITSLRIYEQAMIEGALDSFEGTFDSDGEEKSLESFAIQSAPHARKTECGYYVMRYMIEIITRFDLKRTVNEHFNDMMPYSQEDIDEVRGLWADYFLNN